MFSDRHASAGDLGKVFQMCRVRPEVDDEVYELLCGRLNGMVGGGLPKTSQCVRYRLVFTSVQASKVVKNRLGS